MSIAVAPPVDKIVDLADADASSLAEDRVITWDGSKLTGASRMSWDNANRALRLEGPSFPLRLRYNTGQAGWAIDAPGTNAYGNADMCALALTGTLNVSGGVTTGNFVRVDSNGSGLIENATWSYSIIGPAFVAKGTALNNVLVGLVNDGRFATKDGLQIRNTLTSKPTLEVQTASGQTQPTFQALDSSGVLMLSVNPANGLRIHDTSGAVRNGWNRSGTISGNVAFSDYVQANGELRCQGPFVAKSTATFDNPINTYDVAMRLRPMSSGSATGGQTAVCDVTSSVATLPQFRVQAASGQSVDTFRVTANSIGTSHLSVRSDGITVAHVGLGVGNSAAATTLGSVVKKVEIFDASGASLGFVPIYDSIS